MIIRNLIRNSYPYQIIRFIIECVSWAQRGYSAPSPHLIKIKCLLRNGYREATWVETGTYLGETTRHLSQNGIKIFSIEPEPNLFQGAKKYFTGYKNVEILNGTSEEIFPNLLPRINGSVNFWLDGHYSAGLTFKGVQDTPILDELGSIAQNLSHFDKVCILIDDIRCFNPDLVEFFNYPSLGTLIAWAQKYQFDWHIEHDIFVAKKNNGYSSLTKIGEQI